MRTTRRTTASTAGTDSPLGPVLDVGDRPALIQIAVAAAVAVLASWFPAPDAPPLSASTAERARDWWAANSSALHLTAAALLLLAVAFLALAAGLAGIGRRHAGPSPLADLLLASSTVTAALLTLDTAASAVGLLLPGLVGTTIGDTPDPVVLGWIAIGAWTHLLGDLQIAFVAVAVACGTLIARRVGLLNRWLAYGGILVAACAALGAVGVVTGIAALYPLWFAGQFGLYLALAVLGIASGVALRRIAHPHPRTA